MKSINEAHNEAGEQVLNQEEIDSRIIYRTVKKMLDKFFSAIALIVLSPLFLIVSLLIKHEDHGPVFYVQQRIGRNGKIFNMYKFRSMVINADQNIDKLEKQNEVDGAMFKMRDDPRVTHVGRVIRKYSIDELPQLLNVLQGNMALVGPRPPLEREVKEYTKYDMQRLMVTPGCTGLWQVTERNSVGFHEMVNLDISYIQQSGLLFDFSILFKTIWVMIKPNDAY
ncbi:sugar transferase [Secundilactobacillus yichangensis]|uniref:sugar transferase n=1 Tax=Secundilactobacillus yichangensis TaxID=2799580 RepID=UPI001943EF9F|nr:sugar transferase [Secundilactobacillus yichangensis]